MSSAPPRPRTLLTADARASVFVEDLEASSPLSWSKECVNQRGTHMRAGGIHATFPQTNGAHVTHWCKNLASQWANITRGVTQEAIGNMSELPLLPSFK